MKEPLLPFVHAKDPTSNLADVVVVGAGLIGLSIALELASRGARVKVVERGRALQQASLAAAGMLAVNDPANPAALLEVSRMSAELYPSFLKKIEAWGGVEVPFQTEIAVQYDMRGHRRLAERSIDPRQLAQAVLLAIRATSIELIEETEFRAEDVAGSDVIFASGAWSEATKPMKGQMLRVRLLDGLAMREVHRNEKVYVVPRTVGPRAGTALIGATVEDVGFDTVVHPEDLAKLKTLAADLLPALAEATTVEAWAGLRPATLDGLPMIGSIGPRQWLATGHYRNGVLLAPATAVLLADMVMGMQTQIDVEAFSPARFDR
jgi:glycine oxidase